MKKIIRYLLVMFIVAGFFMQCKEIDDSFKDFVVPGGIVYPQKVVNPMVNSGYQRIKISWLRGADPSVTKARIFWNNYNDSIEVIIPSVGDTISVIINDLPEGLYSFFIITYDDAGNSSVPQEVLGNVYGENHLSILRNRPVVSSFLNLERTVFIHWGPADVSYGAFATEVEYTNVEGETIIEHFSVDESESSLFKLDVGEHVYRYRTLFQPDSTCLDTLFTDFSEISEFCFDKRDWKVLAYSSAHPGNANLVTNVIDNRTDTRWHTDANSSVYPHFVTIDLGCERTITGFELFRMKDDDRACNTFQLMISSDRENWIDLGVFNFNRLTNKGQFYEISPHVVGRYFKFIGLSGPQKYMVLGEMSLYGY
jgi:hypothetical protein